MSAAGWLGLGLALITLEAFFPWAAALWFGVGALVAAAFALLCSAGPCLPWWPFLLIGVLGTAIDLALRWRRRRVNFS